MISDWTTTKNKLENNFSNIILVYCLKWSKKLALMTLLKYNDDYIYTKFQKKLGSVVTWSGEKRNVEYKKFTDWCDKKFDINDKDLRDIFVKIIILSIQIMLNEELTNEKCAKINFSPYLLNLEEFFYICLKNITKYYYYNPDKIYQTKNDNNISNNIIKKQIANYIPFKNIFEKIRYNKSDSNTTVISEISSLDHYKEHDDNKEYNYDKDNKNQDELTYIDSISFDEKEIQRHINTNDEEDEENIKHITLPKISNYNYNKNKFNKDNNRKNINININDPDEKFFSD